ncbi:hypothetical protein HK105_204472 [Polyrhizophydium stewartii]|uniref:Guanylate kinase n=1 Tax=Polyrhizophydium stewartii TaxID=2732419 RepID=A0ABR4N938_9FUNG
MQFIPHLRSSVLAPVTKILAALRRECLDLRMANRDKDTMIAHSARELEARAITIDQLRKQISTLQHVLWSRSSTVQEKPHMALRRTSSGYFSHASRASADMQDHAAAANDRADDMFHDIKNLSLDFASLEAPSSVRHAVPGLAQAPLPSTHVLSAANAAKSGSAGFTPAMPTNALVAGFQPASAAVSSSSSISSLPLAASSSSLSIWAAPNFGSASQESSIDSMRYIWTQPVSAAFSIQPQKSEYGDFYQPEPGIAYEYGTEQLQHEFMDVRHTFKILVEKIVKTNDQPSSIYLQQRLKTDPPEIKARIFEAVLQHVIMLMKNRFGNFLVQCCLDCCTPQQIHVLGNCMRGQVISLSCDRFGCHVMQKAIDRVDEEVKLALVSELLKSIPETFTHRFACHVWQRVLETRWTCEPPNVMLYVQAALAGHWAMVANDENGSLVVQCIFENCSEEESLPIVAEIFEHTADIAKGQWGNWVIQHIIEHGTQQQRAHILEVVSQNIFALSIDQFASKVVEKCIKMASKRDAHALIEKIIAPQVSEQGRPYLLGMMNNQYANYVVQNVLSVADSLQRDICIRLLVPHLHILRGSKYGQRVASMCEKYMRLSQHKFTFTNAVGNATAGGASLSSAALASSGASGAALAGGLGASGPAAASPSTLSGAAKSRSKSNLAGSTQRLSKSKSKSLGSMLNMGPVSGSRPQLTVAAPLEPPAPDHAEDPEAQRRREERELLEEYARRMASLPLPADMLKRGLSQMGPSPDGLRQVFKKLSIPNAGLNNVSALQEYPYLQNLELQGNNITDISAFGSMRYLVQIDLSNNRLTDVLNFEPPPFNLQQVDLSRNQISAIRDLSVHRFLSHLSLERNLIREITGLSNCRSLTHLYLANNGIARIDGIRGLRLRVLDLRGNRITSIEGVETLRELCELRLSRNRLASVSELDGHPLLRLLDLEGNCLATMDSARVLATLPQLRDLSLRGNPLAGLPQATWLPSNMVVPIHATAQFPPSYRLRTVFQLQKLAVLDSLPVSPEEKIAALNTYDPMHHVVVSVQHAHLQKKQAWAYARIKAEDLMRARRLRPIVLCGPNGAGKRTLTSRLLQEFPHIYGLTISHTTRRPRPGEENGVHYHFVSRQEMERMNEEGKLIEVVSLFGNLYGTSMDAVDKVTEEGKICIMDLEIEGVLALRKSHLRPRYIFITTPNMTVLQQRLQARMSPQSRTLGAQETTMSTQSRRLPTMQEESGASAPGAGGDGAGSDAAVEVTSWLAKAEHTRAEFDASLFDLTVVNDDLERAYRELKEYCMSVYWKDFEEED